MATTHDKKSIGEEVTIEPVVLNSVVIKKTIKNIEVPNFVKVDVDIPVFHEKPTTEFIRNEKPTTEFIRTTKPTVEFIRQEMPTTEFVKSIQQTVEFVPEQKPTVEYVREEVPTTFYVKKEVPYDVPVVSMEEVNKIAEKAVETLGTAKAMLDDVNSIIWSFKQATDGINKAVDDLKAKLAGVENYKIDTKTITIEVPEYVKQKVKILGKVVSIGDM